MTLKITTPLWVSAWAMCIFFGFQITSQAADNVPAVTLCSSPRIVSASNVTVADVFCQGVPVQNASHVLAPTPKAGDKLVLSAPDLNRVAQSFKLVWQAPAGAELVIKSDQIIISTDELQKNIAADTKWDEIAADVDVTLFNVPVLTLKAAEKVDLKAVNLVIDESKKTFTATIKAVAAGKDLATQNVQGTWQEMAAVPVVTERVPANTKITANMLSTQRLPRYKLPAGTILAIDNVLGMVAKRALVPNKPLTTNMLSAPLLIKRNDLVTIRYTKGQMQLETRGRAMGNGAKGDWIEVMNLSSKKLLEARVIGPQLTEIIME